MPQHFIYQRKNRFSSQKGILVRCSPTSSLQHHMQLLQAEQFAEWIRLDGVQSHPTEYFPWLEKVLGKDRGESGLILWELSGSAGLAVGWREVSKETCIEKVGLWSVHPTWGEPLRLRQVSTSKFEKYQFVRGHMRAASLHQYFLWCSLASPH